jgi:hypothetical protein
MKKTALILMVLSIGLMTSAQSTFESYMKRVPSLPRDTCNISKADMDSFEQQVTVLLNELSNEIQNRNRNLNDYMEKNKSTMQNNSINQMQQQYGISDEDINKMKNGKSMSKEEKMAMANKMMQQQTNISMGEVENLSKSGEAGKEAWAEGYAAEAQANAQADPKKQTASSTPGTISSLQMEQQSLLKKIKIENDRIAGLYAEVDNDPSGKVMKERIAKWAGQKYKGTIVTDQRQITQDDSLDVLIKNEEIRYCDLLTPKYRNLVRQHLSSVKASEPDYHRVADITSEVTRLQTSVAMPPESSDIPAMEALLEYLDKLGDAYKFKLYFPEDDN